MSAPSPPASAHSISVIEEELVVAGGSTVVHWLVRHNDGWVRATGHPTATVERLERGSGVVWRTRIGLTLAPGARLVRVESRPAPRQRSALEHLTSSARGGARTSQKRPFVVNARGDLELDAPTPGSPKVRGR